MLPAMSIRLSLEPCFRYTDEETDEIVVEEDRPVEPVSHVPGEESDDGEREMRFCRFGVDLLL